MVEKNENPYILLNEKFKKIKKELFEEGRLKFPSFHILEKSASEIMELLKNPNIADEEFEFWASWKIREMDIFIADLVGELHHDYDNKLVRYYNKWIKEKGKIDSLIFEFTPKFSARME